MIAFFAFSLRLRVEVRRPPAKYNADMKFLLAFAAAAGLLTAADVTVGKQPVLKQPVAIAVLLAKPADYVGKTVQVKGKISEVCQEMGCFMYVADAAGAKLKIKVKDGEIVFPKDAAGKTATAEGVFTKLDLTREQAIDLAKEEAGATGRKFDPASIKGPVTLYQINGTGAVISE